MAGTRHAKTSLFISFSMVALAYLTGTVTILSYITVIFEQTGSALSEKHSSILVIVTQVWIVIHSENCSTHTQTYTNSFKYYISFQLTGNLVFMNIVERFNRKTLYISSALSTAVLFFLFGAYGFFELKNLGYTWLPPVCISLTIFSSCLGLLPIPYVVTSEIFPKKVCSIAIKL